MQKREIFKEVQERYNIKDVAEELGIRLHRVGRSWRANSPKGNGDGKDAFAIYEETNTWYDFMTQQGGDIVDLYAMMKYDGDKGKAIQELMPEETRETVKKQISARETFMNDIELFSKKMLNDNTPIAVKSRNYLHSRGITDETIKALKIGFDVSGELESLIGTRRARKFFTLSQGLFLTTTEIAQNHDTRKHH